MSIKTAQPLSNRLGEPALAGRTGSRRPRAARLV